MNRKFKDLEYSALLDQLAHYTLNYTKLLNDNGTAQEKEACQQTIRRIMAEIKIREKESEGDLNTGRDRSNKNVR